MPFMNFQDYLRNLSQESEGTTYDYGLYLSEIASMRAFAHYSSVLIFLIDYQTMTYPFMDSNVIQVLGHSQEAFREGGLEFSFHNNQHFKLLNKEIFRDRAEFLSKHKNENLSDLRFSMGFGYKDRKGKIRHILQKHTITQVTDEPLPKGILGFCWDITGQSKEPDIFHQIERFDAESQEWRTVLNRVFFPGVDPDQLLSKREIEIMKWLVSGMSSKQIADRMFLSYHTINTHRKNMLRRTNSKNTAELIQYATRFGLI